MLNAPPTPVFLLRSENRGVNPPLFNYMLIELTKVAKCTWVDVKGHLDIIRKAKVKSVQGLSLNISPLLWKALLKLRLLAS